MKYLYISKNNYIRDNPAPPRSWKNIELITKNYDQQFDIMYAYDDSRQGGSLYLGHFNDGIVE